MKAFISLALAAIALSGCQVLDPLLNPVPSGVVTGVVLFNGAPAAGKRVSLVGATQKGYTNAAGRYTFSGVPAGTRVYVHYQSVFDSKVDTNVVEDPRLPNEVELWQSAAFSLDGAGKEVPPFDVAYNGPLYPDKLMSLIVNATSPVPFHWSTHPQAQKYRVKIESAANEPIWSSDWTGDPTALFAKAVPPGSYKWKVEIDGGERGIGLTRPRQVDF
jgi:hypothetical protein